MAHCNSCGESLYYSGSCLGEWEHIGGSRDCKKQNIKKENKMIDLKELKRLAENPTIFLSCHKSAKKSGHAYLSCETILQLIKEHQEMREALGLFEKELTIGSDGTNLKCTCSRENCHSLWLSAGDIIYRVSYAHTEKLKALTQKAEE